MDGKDGHQHWLVKIIIMMSKMVIRMIRIFILLAYNPPGSLGYGQKQLTKHNVTIPYTLMNRKF